MVEAKNLFREGFIRLVRPFQFENNLILQKLTIVWAYSERPIMERVLNPKGEEEYEKHEALSEKSISLFSKNERLEKLSHIKEALLKSNLTSDEVYVGSIVQAEIKGTVCRFFPNEYSILSEEMVNQIMEEEGYHLFITPALRNIKPFIDLSFYIRSRGINEDTANKWASLSFKNLAIYIPYFELLTMFCRPNEILVDDPFYIEKEGIDFTEIKIAQSNQRAPLITFNNG